MRQVSFNEVGGAEVLRVIDTEMPLPGANEVLVRVKACGLNRAEELFFQGQYLFQPEFPAKLGLEASGTIVDVGEGVDHLKAGMDVCLTPNVKITDYGFLGEYVVAPVGAVVTKPTTISFREAAAVWMSYGTAYGALVQRGGLEKGKGTTVLITAASSSVGTAAIQLAKRYGAKVIATTRSSAKKEFLTDLGADHVVATNEENLAERVLKITGGKGAEIIIDAIAGNILEDLVNCAAVEAKIVIYGVLSLEPTPLPLFPAIIKGVQISGFHYAFQLLEIPERFAAMREEVLAGIDAGDYKPLLDRDFPLAEIRDAYNYMASNQQRGKITVAVN